MTQTTILQNTFEIILQVVKPDTGERETLTELSASVVGWEECAPQDDDFMLGDHGLEVSERGTTDDDDQPDVEIEDDEDQAEDDDTTDDDDDEDEEEPKIVLHLSVNLSVEAVKEYIAYRDSEDVFEDLLVTVVYTGMNSAAVFAHQYRCDPNLDLIHTASSQATDGNASAHFNLECYESAKFNTVTEGHVYL